MCGIAGFIGSGDLSDLHHMLQSLQHRGPDGEGVWRDQSHGVFLGHRRLAIIDLTDGTQPMTTSDNRFVITYNGEIYNHIELRRQLETLGHRFTTGHCDTEVLLHGYREWGADLVDRLNGMWAFAIYDVDRRQLFLSRDRFGQKPLFYTFQHGTLAFASEASSLLRHPLVSAGISRLSVLKYFAYGFIPAPRSLYERIYKLPAGNNLRFDLKTSALNIRRYWDFVLEPDESLAQKDELDLAEELRRLLRQAVERQMMSDVPIGVFLSGGLDSSTVTHFACLSRGTTPLQTFSLGFDEPAFDESANAALVADELGTSHNQVMFSSDEFGSVAHAAVDQIDEPIADSSLIPTSLLCQFAKQKVTVALGGDGADELLCGYDTFRAVRLAQTYARLVPRPVHAAIRTIAARLPAGQGYMSFGFRLQRLLQGLSYPPQLWNPVWLGALDPLDFQACFREPVMQEEIYEDAIELWDQCPSSDVLDRTMQFYVRLYFQDGILTKLDRAGMQHSLEIRCPFLDVDVVDFIRRLPRELKFRSTSTKHLLRKSMQEILSTSVLKQRKHGFPFPVGKWLQRGQIAQEPIRPLPDQRGDFLKARWQNHLHGCRDERMFLWSQWVLNQFLTRHD